MSYSAADAFGDLMGALLPNQDEGQMIDPEDASKWTNLALAEVERLQGAALAAAALLDEPMIGALPSEAIKRLRAALAGEDDDTAEGT